MFWQVIGWSAVAIIGVYTVYGLFYHQRIYARLATRAYMDDTGVLKEEIVDPLSHRIASRYLTRATVMFVIKLAAILFLLYMLLP